MSVVPLINWATGQEVGQWVEHPFQAGGCTSDWTPILLNWDKEDPAEELEIQQHPEGYKWLKLPGGGKELFHRQLHQDLVAKAKIPRDQEVHHRNHMRWDNRLQNLEVAGARQHRQHHARARRAAPVLGRRHRNVRRG